METDAESDSQGGAIGESVNSKPGRRLVTGHGEYVDDIQLAGTKHARFVRSQYAHARIESVDTSAAEAIDGVELVWTAEDIDPYVQRFGHPSLDRPDEEALASDRVRYVGDEIAVVLADDRETAIRAADEVDVEYDRLEPLTTIDDALAEDADPIHPDLDADPDCEVDGNVVHRSHVVAGDTDAALAEADLVVEDEFYSHKTNPLPLEPHGCVIDYNPGEQELTVWSSNQVPHLLKGYMANAVNALAEEDIVCKMPDIGGGFGVKLGLYSHEVCAAVLAMEVGSPIKFVWDRLEEIQAGRGRHPERFDARMGFDSDGNIVAFDVDMEQNTGAFGTFGKTVAFSASVTSAGPYLIPNQDIRGTVVYTNVMPGTAVRGYGDVQFTFVREQLIDSAADELGIDPIDLRMRNVAKQEDMPLRTAAGLKFKNADMPECLRRVREGINWDEHRGGYRTRNGNLRGVGLGTILKRGGNKSAKGADYSSAVVQMDKRGNVRLFSGITSIGQGTETGISQIVADTLGVSADRVTPIVGDTDVTPDGLGVWADRGTIIGGTAAARAAEDLRDTIDELAAYALDIDEADVVLADGRVYEAGDPDNGMTMAEFADLATFGDPEDRPEHMKDGVSLVGEAKFETREAEFLDEETGTGNISHGYTFGALAALVEVDTGTGEVEVIDVAICEDVGKLINPKLAEGQIQGGIVHALGEVLLEEMDYDENGGLRNGTLVDYHLPTSADVPMITNIEEVESPDPATSHGQKGLGECSTVPVAAAVANALRDATGIQFTETPFTPDNVLPELIEADLREL
jgi:carbon-monoxide dehydrogenase large subunit